MAGNDGFIDGSRSVNNEKVPVPSVLVCFISRVNEGFSENLH